MARTTTEASPFGAMLERLRRRAGLSQQELAERAGLSRRGLAYLMDAERVGDLLLKGFVRPVPTYSVLGLRAADLNGAEVDLRP